jgi:hypothetical protein
LVTPAAVARFVIKYRHGVCGLTVHNQLIERVLARLHAGGALYGMNSADKIQCIDNEQMDGHGVLPYESACRVTFTASGGEDLKQHFAGWRLTPYPAYK